MNAERAIRKNPLERMKIRESSKVGENYHRGWNAAIDDVIALETMSAGVPRPPSRPSPTQNSNLLEDALDLNDWTPSIDADYPR